MKHSPLQRFAAFLLFVLPVPAYADSAQWNLNPISSDWNTAAKWTPTTAPNGLALALAL